MVITIDIDNFSIMKTLVDKRRSVNILYWKTFKKMKIPKVEIQSYTKFNEGKASKTIKIRCLVVDGNTSYNILFG